MWEYWFSFKFTKDDIVSTGPNGSFEDYFGSPFYL